jgi:hypothetical protein
VGYLAPARHVSYRSGSSMPRLEALRTVLSSLHRGKQRRIGIYRRTLPPLLFGA